MKLDHPQVFDEKSSFMLFNNPTYLFMELKKLRILTKNINSFEIFRNLKTDCNVHFLNPIQNPPLTLISHQTPPQSLRLQRAHLNLFFRVSLHLESSESQVKQENLS